MADDDAKTDGRDGTKVSDGEHNELVDLGNVFEVTTASAREVSEQTCNSREMAGAAAGRGK